MVWVCAQTINFPHGIFNAQNQLEINCVHSGSSFKKDAKDNLMILLYTPTYTSNASIWITRSQKPLLHEQVLSHDLQVITSVYTKLSVY